ncbi:MAG: DUF4835 family protein [Ignavibacteriaceae bacterium]|nr:DUF4835 family protein [Ignavibacteriaceae bacterium]
MKSFIVALLLFSSVAFAQELNCSVTVNLANLAPSDRPLISGFDVAVKDYMNKTKFSSGDWQNDKITCAFTILLLTASNDGNFSAQVIVTSSRPVYQSNKTLQMLRINDGNWQFTYQKGQGLVANQSAFDPLTSFLDYYANIIIGYNEDSWDELGGTSFFNKAYKLCNLANSTTFSKGWSRSGMYSRQALAEDILNDKYQPYREAYYQLYYGIDYYENKREDVKKAQDVIVGAINTIAGMRNQIDFSSIVLRTFFDASSGTIVNYLTSYPDKSIFKTLKLIDPSHTSQYDAAINLN